MAFESVFVEQWAEYSLGVVIFLIRIYARLSTAGWRNFERDDIFILLSIAAWTGVNVSVYILNSNVSFTAAPNGLIMNEAKEESFRRGSRAVITSWCTYLTLLWLLKACWLCMFSRLTLGLWQQKLIKIFIYMIAVAYMVAISMIFVHCIPSDENWHVQPLSNDLYQVVHGRYYLLWTVVNYIVTAVMNCGTDLMLLTIPLPLLWKLQISFGRKLVVSLFLCSGLFVVTAAILRCVLSLGAIADVHNSTIWGIREEFVAICAVCAPGIRTLFLRAGKGSTIGFEDGSGVRDIELKDKISTLSEDRYLRDRAASLEKIGISMTSELIHHPGDIAFRLSTSEFPTTRIPRPWSDGRPQSPGVQYFHNDRKPLSTIYSEADPDSRNSLHSIGASLFLSNRISLHTTPEVHIDEVAKPSQVHVRSGPGLQQEVEADPHIYHNGEIDLEKGSHVHTRHEDHRDPRQGGTEDDLVIRKSFL